jgi:hypothetical protein
MGYGMLGALLQVAWIDLATMHTLPPYYLSNNL